MSPVPVLPPEEPGPGREPLTEVEQAAFDDLAQTFIETSARDEPLPGVVLVRGLWDGASAAFACLAWNDEEGDVKMIPMALVLNPEHFSRIDFPDTEKFGQDDGD